MATIPRAREETVEKRKDICRKDNEDGEEKMVKRARGAEQQQQQRKKMMMKKKKKMLTRKEKREREEEEQEEEVRRLTLCPARSSHAANTHATGLFHPDAVLNEVLAGGGSRPRTALLRSYRQASFEN